MKTEALESLSKTSTWCSPAPTALSSSRTPLWILLPLTLLNLCPPPQPFAAWLLGKEIHLTTVGVCMREPCAQGNHSSSTFFFRHVDHGTNCMTFPFCIRHHSSKTYTLVFHLLSFHFCLPGICPLPLQPSSPSSSSPFQDQLSSLKFAPTPDARPAQTRPRGAERRR